MIDLEYILDLVAPHECVKCSAEGPLLCDKCISSLTLLPPRCYLCFSGQNSYRTCRSCRAKSPLFSVWPAASYDDPVAKELVRRLKFDRAKAAAKVMARALSDIVPADSMLITYVPTANARVRIRGYDQSALIAKELSRLSGHPHLPLLARTGVQRQLGQDRKTRKQQLNGAFRVINRDAIQNKHILVIDDVLTTGSTCEAAASALKQAGAKRVSAAIFAVA